MSRLLKFASWNVEQFKNNQGRAARIANFLKDDAHAPDLFAIFEVTGDEVFDDFVKLLPTHNFFVTEGLQLQETLIGVKKGITAFVTQRHAFKAKTATLRPGTLVTAVLNGENYSFLFLHVKSLTDPRGWGLRTDMMEHAINLKKALDRRTPNGDANFIVAGDLNTMGLNVRDGNNDLTGDEEITRLKRRFRRVDMSFKDKDQPHTWWGGGRLGPSDLDHVIASDHLDIRAKDGAAINVLGWPQEPTDTKKRKWLDDFSDHALLYGELHG